MLGKGEGRNQTVFEYSRLRIKRKHNYLLFPDKTDQLVGRQEEESVKLFKIQFHLMAL